MIRTPKIRYPGTPCFRKLPFGALGSSLEDLALDFLFVEAGLAGNPAP